MSTHAVRRTTRPDPGRILIGIVLVLVGGALLLERFAAVDVGDVFGTIWPLVLLLPGVAGLATTRGTGVGPWILTFLGGGFLLANLDVIGDDWLGTAWPLLLILLGVAILFRRPGLSAFGTGTRQVDDPRVERIAVFSGNHTIITSHALESGSATALFGGVDLDLRQALPVAEGAHVHAFAMFGGVTLIVPETWQVQLRGLPLFGGIDDKRPLPQSPPSNPPVLHVNATALFGGVEVTSTPS